MKPDSLTDFDDNRIEMGWRLCRVLPGHQVEHRHWHLVVHHEDDDDVVRAVAVVVVDGDDDDCQPTVSPDIWWSRTPWGRSSEQFSSSEFDQGELSPWILHNWYKDSYLLFNVCHIHHYLVLIENILRHLGKDPKLCLRCEGQAPPWRRQPAQPGPSESRQRSCK